MDPALPIENVSGTIDSVVAGYGQTFGLFGRSASLGLVVPYVDAQVKGDVAEVTRSVTRTGFGDLRLRFTLGLLGSPAAFAARICSTHAGVRHWARAW